MNIFNPFTWIKFKRHEKAGLVDEDLALLLKQYAERIQVLEQEVKQNNRTKIRWSYFKEIIEDYLRRDGSMMGPFVITILFLIASTITVNCYISNRGSVLQHELAKRQLDLNHDKDVTVEAIKAGMHLERYPNTDREHWVK